MVVAGAQLSRSPKDKSWFIAQMAAWVRLFTLILRRIALIWTLTVASAISFLRAIALLESPSIKQRSIHCSRADSLGL